MEGTETPRTSPLPTGVFGGAVSARRQSSPAQRGLCTPSPGSAGAQLPLQAVTVGRRMRGSSLLPGTTGAHSTQKPSPCSSRWPLRAAAGTEGGLTPWDGTRDLTQQHPLFPWPEPPRNQAALWGSHDPVSPPLGPRGQSCEPPTALGWLPLPRFILPGRSPEASLVHGIPSAP